eukprot:11154438-Lingulodinium_polyedra.AAC.1
MKSGSPVFNREAKVFKEAYKKQYIEQGKRLEKLVVDTNNIIQWEKGGAYRLLEKDGEFWVEHCCGQAVSASVALCLNNAVLLSTITR